MEELSKGLDLSIKGPAREEALNTFYQQIQDWQIAMPKFEPLVVDFGLGDFSKTGLIEFWIANETDAGYCAKYLFLFDGQTCPMHRHKTKKESFFMVKGQLRVNYDGTEMTLEPGDVLLVEPWKYHCLTGIGPSLFLEISMPCFVDDNYFANTRIPIGGNYKKE